jgi:hypothetical protein
MEGYFHKAYNNVRSETVARGEPRLPEVWDCHYDSASYYP